LAGCDPARRGDKSGQWAKWYRAAILRAERLYEEYLGERRKETSDE
jgi:hypothetical protein